MFGFQHSRNIMKHLETFFQVHPRLVKLSRDWSVLLRSRQCTQRRPNTAAATLEAENARGNHVMPNESKWLQFISKFHQVSLDSCLIFVTCRPHWIQLVDVCPRAAGKFVVHNCGRARFRSIPRSDMESETVLFFNMNPRQSKATMSKLCKQCCDYASCKQTVGKALQHSSSSHLNSMQSASFCNFVSWCPSKGRTGRTVKQRDPWPLWPLCTLRWHSAVLLPRCVCGLFPVACPHCWNLLSIVELYIHIYIYTYIHIYIHIYIYK